MPWRNAEEGDAFHPSCPVPASALDTVSLNLVVCNTSAAGFYVSTAAQNICTMFCESLLAQIWCFNDQCARRTSVPESTVTEQVLWVKLSAAAPQLNPVGSMLNPFSACKYLCFIVEVPSRSPVLLAMPKLSKFFTVQNYLIFSNLYAPALNNPT